ncbi:hypothetical protein Ocin01_00917 [Orchesella cincta]|uniref:C2H2-type domain-containing protein n=1 Tax=Orchesella cincta TaxID=48709 RepID=A0A1D2NKF2_ORCCI|nr:hypothetical protein Ocin01_00917 [Orchesella cincta]
MSQNVCLVCCYTFQEKRNRVITDETREGFHKFCRDLGFLFENRRSKGQPKNSCLELPFGDAITVCGDCLSLIVIYVQRRSIQLEQEEKLEELQRAVVKALKELSVVVKDVETHISEIQDIVRTGDESSLKKFVKKDDRGCQNGAKSFRGKILAVNSRGSRPVKATPVICGNQDMILPVICVQSDHVKIEPVEYEEAYIEVSPYADEPQLPSPQDGMDDDDFEDFGTDGEVTTSRRIEGFSLSKRNIRKSLSDYRNSGAVQSERSEVESEEEDDDSEYDDAASDFSEDCKLAHQSVKRKSSRRNDPDKPKRGRGRPRKIKIATPFRASEPSQSPEDWKNDLIGRILEEWGNNDDESHWRGEKSMDSESRLISVSQESEAINPLDGNVCTDARHLQIVDDGLKFLGVKIEILEKQKTLLCVRCGRKFKDDKVKAELESPVEIQIRNHIITKHPPSTKKSREMIEVISYISTSRKQTTKIACPKMYRYDRRCDQNGRSYFRCDDRKSNCGASILLYKGEYSKMVNGWTADGYHTLHPPNPAKTEEQIALGRAKQYLLSNPTLTIGEVWDKFVKESNGQIPTTVSERRVRRILHFSRYGHERMPETEKEKRMFPCPHCNKLCQGGRGLATHVKVVHKTPRTGREGSGKFTSSGRVSNPAAKRKRSPKPKHVNRQIGSNPPTTSSDEAAAGSQAPCGIFADPKQAHNFVNKCITAIMQQVGIPVPPTNSVIQIERPAAPSSVTASQCSNTSVGSSSAAPDPCVGTSFASSTSQAGDGSNHQRSVSAYSSHPNPGQWNQFAIHSHGQHLPPQGQLNLAPKSSNPMQWPWREGSH